MFYYFGRKGRLAPLYPSPDYDTVVEPFAGSMAYTLHHQPGTAIGVEFDPNVCSVWQRLLSMSEEEIADFPEPNIGDIVTDRWLMMAAGSDATAKSGHRTWTKRMAKDMVSQKRLAIKNLEYARNHIKIIEGHYKYMENIEATWFIDPPYQHVKQGYVRHDLNYAELAEFCMTRSGQVIVCEQEGADWLPFRRLCEIKGTNNKRTAEVIWTNSI